MNRLSIIVLFLFILSGCATKQSENPPPADSAPRPGELYADSSEVHIRAGKDGPTISFRDLIIGVAEQKEVEGQPFAAPAADSKCPLKQADSQPDQAAKLLQPK